MVYNYIYRHLWSPIYINGSFGIAVAICLPELYSAPWINPRSYICGIYTMEKTATTSDDKSWHAGPPSVL